MKCIVLLAIVFCTASCSKKGQTSSVETSQSTRIVHTQRLYADLETEWITHKTVFGQNGILKVLETLGEANSREAEGKEDLRFWKYRDMKLFLCIRSDRDSGNLTGLNVGHEY